MQQLKKMKKLKRDKLILTTKVMIIKPIKVAQVLIWSSQRGSLA